MSAIFLVRGDNDLVELRETPYDSEAVLQSLLAEHPQLLGGDASGGATWLLLKREMTLNSGGSSGAWSVDHLFVDQDAVPTLVEVKQSSNSEIRRSVVGQLLDYAANAVVYWPIEKLRATFETSVAAVGKNPDDLIAAVAGPDRGPDEFWQAVATNLQAQRIRLVFVADQIPAELARVIEFLNGQMSPAEVIGIEVRQFAGEGLKTLVPKVIGKTAESAVRKGTPARPARSDWDWDAYASELRTSPDRIAVAQAVTAKVAEYIQRHNLDWRIVGRKGYMAILRAGDYKVGVVDVLWRKAPRFAVKLPSPPSDLGLTSPYQLPEDWDPREKEWGWTVSANDIPDVALALDLARPYHPASGGMVNPSGIAL